MGKLNSEGDGLFSVFAGARVNSQMVDELDLQARIRTDDPVEQLKITMEYHQNEAIYIASSKKLIEALEIAGASIERLEEVRSKVENLELGHNKLSLVIEKAKSIYGLK